MKNTVLCLLALSSIRTFATPALYDVWRAEDRRLKGDSNLLSALKLEDRIGKAAIRAVGRIGDSAAIESLSQVLESGSNPLKKLAAESLGLINTPAAFKVISDRLPAEKNAEIAASLIQALGNTGNETAVTLINAVLTKPDSIGLHAISFHALGKLWGGDSAKWKVPDGLLALCEKAVTADSDAALMAAFALSRFKGDWKDFDDNGLRKKLADDLNPDTKGYLCRLFAKKPIPQTRIWIYQQLTSKNPPGLLIECLKPLEREPVEDKGVQAASVLLKHPNTSVRIQALNTISAAKMVKLSPQVEKLIQQDRSKWVEGEALKVLCVLNAETCRPYLDKSLKDEKSHLFLSALEASGQVGSPKDFENLLSQTGSSETRVSAKAWEVLAQQTVDKLPKGLKLEAAKALEKNDIAILSNVVDGISKWKWTDFREPLEKLFARLDSTEYYEIKSSIASTLKDLGFAPPTLPTPITATDFTADEVEKALKSKVTLKTNRGAIELRFFEEAPLTVLHFVRFSRKNGKRPAFYAGKTFHRVVPHFVVQGGDPRGDGYGGPGFLIRDEVSSRSHTRGTMGIATAGKDTGGSQFFINLAPNLHLDGKYTNFAEVTRGIEVAENLEIGDSVTSVEVSE